MGKPVRIGLLMPKPYVFLNDREVLTAYSIRISNLFASAQRFFPRIAPRAIESIYPFSSEYDLKVLNHADLDRLIVFNDVSYLRKDFEGLRSYLLSECPRLD